MAINTAIPYETVDGDARTEAVVRGTMSDTQMLLLKSALRDGGRFIPAAVGLPSAARHVSDESWHVLRLREITTTVHDVTRDQDVTEFIEDFCSVTSWNTSETAVVDTSPRPVSEFIHTNLLRCVPEHPLVADIKLAGRACLFKIRGSLLGRAQFTTTTHASRFDALDVQIIDPHHGHVDALRIPFLDVWGRRVSNDGANRVDVCPSFRVNTDTHTAAWNRWSPTDEDYAKLLTEVQTYVSAFADLI